MTTEKTLHIKKPKIIRASAKEDFAPIAALGALGKLPAQESAPAAPIASTRRDLDEMSMLDLFAMVVCPGVAKRIEIPELIAIESYKIAMEMVRMSKNYRQE